MEENKKNNQKAKHTADENMPRTPKSKSKKGISLPLVIILVIVVIAIGVAAGYLIGRSGKTDPKSADNANIVVTDVEAVSVTGEPGEAENDDVFTQELNGVNDSALSDLSGESAAEDTVAVLQDDQSLESVGMDVAEDDTTVVAEYDGGKIYRGEAAEEYNDMLSMFLFAGYNESDVSEDLIQETLEDMVRDRITEAHAKEMGITELTDDEKQVCEQTATSDYAEQVSFYIDFVREDGMTDQEAEKAAEQFLEEYEGITFDSIYNDTVSAAVADKLYNELTKDVTVSEDDIKAAYDDALSLQQESFTESAENYELSQSSGEVIVYNLEGYRAVKIINVYLDDDVLSYMLELEDELSTLDTTKDAARIEEIQTELTNCYGECEARAQSALDELKAGADFDEVYNKYSGDVEFTDKYLLKTGYYISKNSTIYDEETIQTAMALANPGDLSEVVLSDNGAFIIKYIGDVTPGAVDYDSVHDALSEQTLTQAKETAYNSQCDAWVEAAHPVYYVDRMY